MIKNVLYYQAQPVDLATIELFNDMETYCARVTDENELDLEDEALLRKAAVLKTEWTKNEANKIAAEKCQVLPLRRRCAQAAGPRRR